MGPPVAKADAVHKVTNGVGMLWRVHRRSLPLLVEEVVLDLLLALQVHVLPDAKASLAANVQEARTEVQSMLGKLCNMATREATLAGGSSNNLSATQPSRRGNRHRASAKVSRGV